MDTLTLITYIIVLLFSVIIHELAHGYTAEALGDPTARLAGRLTLNPLRHIDMMGSVLLPLLLIITHSPILLGWAKPVPFNPYNFTRHRRWGGALVAIAGPLSNILIAVIFTIIIRLAPSLGMSGNAPFMTIAGTIVLLNITLTIFNLLPIPPLDGHHVLFALLSPRYERIKKFIMRYSPVLFLVVFFLIWGWVERIIVFVFHLMTGMM
jgi:Zn-dependent protease